MSKTGGRIETDISDGEGIDPSELIDAQENKPKISQQENLIISDEHEKEPVYRRIERKPVSKLTTEESDYLIDLYKNGGEDDYYKVYFYKNGTNKIVKKKQPPKYNTAKRLLEQQQQQAKPVMTTEQVLMEHVIDLEAKYATLYQKHKKLKKNYKSLHEDIYFDDEDDRQNVNTLENPKSEQVSQPEPEPIPEPIQNNTQTDFQNNYINKIRRPQKGYRRMMANM